MFKAAYKISAGQGLFVHATCARDCGALLCTLSGNCVGLMPRGLRSELSSLMFLALITYFLRFKKLFYASLDRL